MRGVLGTGRTNGIIGALVLLVVSVLVAGCTGAGRSNSDPAPLAQISIQPDDKAENVKPTQPASVTVTGGEIREIALTNADGKAVAGTLSPDRADQESIMKLATQNIEEVAA